MQSADLLYLFVSGLLQVIPNLSLRRLRFLKGLAAKSWFQENVADSEEKDQIK